MDISLLQGNTSAAVQEHDGKKPWTKRAIKEICAFLILSNVMVMSCVFICRFKTKYTFLCGFLQLYNTSMFLLFAAVGHPCLWSPPPV